jgi:uncharacterized membrane protein YGL010W
MKRFLVNYRARHRHPLNVMLHAVGLPLTFVVPIPLLVHHSAVWAAAAFLTGYLLQFAGHAIEGNDAGEIILVKKSLGLSYVDVVDPPNRSSDNR